MASPNDPQKAKAKGPGVRNETQLELIGADTAAGDDIELDEFVALEREALGESMV